MIYITTNADNTLAEVTEGWRKSEDQMEAEGYPEGYDYQSSRWTYTETDGFVYLGQSQEVINATNLEYLAETDWYVTRKYETGKAIPQEVLIKRQEPREAIQND